MFGKYSLSIQILLLTTLVSGQAALALDEQEWNDNPDKFQNSYQCLNVDPKQKRTLRYIIVNYTQDTPVPCKVTYQKPTEGMPDKVLWQSSNTQGYCEQKATGLADKLGGYGWTCTLPEGQIAYNQSNETVSGSSQADASDLDFNLPTITLESNDAEAIIGQPYDVVVEVTDDIGVKNVQFYHKSADAGYQPLSMNRVEESNRYQVTLDEQLTSSDSLKFYILAEDVSDNTALYGNSISPRTFKFVQASQDTEGSADEEVLEQPELALEEEETILEDQKSALTSNASFKVRASSEQSLWQRAVSSNDIVGYESYIKFYPYGNYTAMARARLDYLRKRAKQEKHSLESVPATRPANSDSATPSSLW